MSRLHPLSAVERVLLTAVRGGVAGTVLGLVLTGPLGLGPQSVPLVLAAAGAVAGAGLAVARYLRFTYAIDGTTLTVTSGVLRRQERTIPLGRVQNVDVTRRLPHRVFGLAVVRFETAGGGSTEAVIDAVRTAEAHRLRDRVSAVGDAREATPDTDPTPSRPADPARDGESGPAGTTPPTDRRPFSYDLSVPDLLVLGAVSASPAAPVMVLLGTPVFGDVALGVVSATSAALGGPAHVALARLPGYTVRDLVVVGAVVLVELGLATWFVNAVLVVVSHYGFHVERVGDELRYERGLVNRYSGSIPLGKVQTVAIRETAPMRWFGYAALSVETAGYGVDREGRTANVVVPLDDRETVASLAESVGSVEFAALDRPPARARRRYAARFAAVAVAVAALALGVGHGLALSALARWWFLPLFAAPLAVLGGHLKWRHRGHATTEDAFLARDGFWRRSTLAVPYYRVQTVIGRRTLFQRYRDLASVTADTAGSSGLFGGDATAHDVDAGTARSVQEALRTRLAADIRRRRRDRGG